ncbi:hypothetical protein MOQ_007525 [Trypanosoma cruzi marinkellei]|uniref:Trans-sialidase n=1 Tax=Trypanosoma cruzi marinkellei TaxID=85056 RepID=K2MSS0_TRYCR|nr:hypothetical protein MOQ_007525 [Trypanosoma cruzi marinkellei]
MRAAERHLHLFASRACRCCEEVQATSRYWAAEAVFPPCSAGDATLRAHDALVCIDAPNGVSRSRAVAVRLLCSSLRTWPPVACLIWRAMACGPPLGGCLLVFVNFCVLLRALGNNGCGDGGVVFRCEWWRCVLLLCCLSAAVACCPPPRRKLLPNAKCYCEKRRLQKDQKHTHNTHIYMLLRVAAVKAPRTHNRRRVTGSSGGRREGRESERQRTNMSRHHFYSAVLLLLVVMVCCGSGAAAVDINFGKHIDPFKGTRLISSKWEEVKATGGAIFSLHPSSLVEVNGDVFVIGEAQCKKGDGKGRAGIASKHLKGISAAAGILTTNVNIFCAQLPVEKATKDTFTPKDII